MTVLYHDTIALQAWQLWQNRGCPDGCDVAIWLEAEQSLRDGPAAEIFSAYAYTNTTLESEGEHNLSPDLTDQQSIQAAIQRDVARAPQVPHHTGLKAKPPETGKPLWSRPHSS